MTLSTNISSLAAKSIFFSDLFNWTLNVERWTLSVLFMHGERRGGACLCLPAVAGAC
jgi:hypothetical protein